MPIYDRWLNRAIARLGYTKATDMGIAPVFAGEAPVGGEFGSNDMSQEQREQLAITSAWVYSDIDVIASEASAADIDIYQGPEEIEDHPVELLLERPNPHMTASWMRRYTVMWLLLRGEAYWLKVFSAAGELVELWPIPSSHIEPIPDATDYIRGFRYTSANGRPPILFEPRQIVFFRLPNPFDYHRGLSPLSAYRRAVELDVSANEWNRRTFNDDVTLRTIISLPETISKADFSRAITDIRQSLIDQKQKYIIIRSGQMAAEVVGTNPKDMEFLAGRTFNREEIDRVFKIPAGFWAKEATRANSDAAKAVMIDQAVWPLLVLMAETLTGQFVRPEYGDGLTLRFEDIRSEDREMLVKERAAYWKVKTVDEARHDLGLEPLGNTDVGETLVSMVTANSATADVSNTGFGEEATVKAAEDDLHRWERIARRRVKAGEDAVYPFESEHIPQAIKATVLDNLKTATTDEEVKAAFAAGFRGICWEGYP